MEKICLATFKFPWFFGPYSKQSILLAKELIKNYEVFYLTLSIQNLPRIEKHTFQSLKQSYFHETNEVDSEFINRRDIVPVLNKIEYLLGIDSYPTDIGNSKMSIKSINTVLKHFKIDHILVLYDLISFYPDSKFICNSISWFPNHYFPLNKKSITMLSLFDKIASLSPTDTKLITSQFPEKIVSWIPHIIEVPEVSEVFDLLQIVKIRNKYQIPEKSFVVLVLGGSYYINNRKAIDTILFSFEKYYQKNPNVFYYIHMHNNMKGNNQNRSDLQKILKYLNIPKKNYILDQKLRPYSEITELIQLSDVCTVCSKAEGFGLPILEAQSYGKPVITTKFGAMFDYTYYGISVEPLQRSYDVWGDGIWVEPDCNGIVEALVKIQEDYPYYANVARDKIAEEMSSEKVTKKFQKLIKNEITN